MGNASPGLLIAVVVALLLATAGNVVATYRSTDFKSKVEAAFCVPAD